MNRRVVWQVSVRPLSYSNPTGKAGWIITKWSDREMNIMRHPYLRHVAGISECE